MLVTHAESVGTSVHPIPCRSSPIALRLKSSPNLRQHRADWQLSFERDLLVRGHLGVFLCRLETRVATDPLFPEVRNALRTEGSDKCECLSAHLARLCRIARSASVQVLEKLRECCDSCIRCVRRNASRRSSAASLAAEARSSSAIVWAFLRSFADTTRATIATATAAITTAIWMKLPISAEVMRPEYARSAPPCLTGLFDQNLPHTPRRVVSLRRRTLKHVGGG